MKKVYTGLKAEKINFGTYDMATTGSAPPGCIHIVANIVQAGTQTCSNPPDTTSYQWYFDHPQFPDD